MEKEKRVLLKGVKEYSEEGPVFLNTRKDGRLSILAFNEGGYNSTEVDVLQLIACLKSNFPELIDKPVEATNEQPKSRFLVNYETYECQYEDHYKVKRSKIVVMTDEELNDYVSKLLNPKVTYLG